MVTPAKAGIRSLPPARTGGNCCGLHAPGFPLSSVWRAEGLHQRRRCGCQAGSPQPQANFACACALKKIRVTSIMLRSDAPVRHKARSSDQTERTQRYRVVAPLVCWISVICASRHTQAPPEGWLGGLALPARTEAADRRQRALPSGRAGSTHSCASCTAGALRGAARTTPPPALQASQVPATG